MGATEHCFFWPTTRRLGTLIVAMVVALAALNCGGNHAGQDAQQTHDATSKDDLLLAPDMATADTEDGGEPGGGDANAGDLAVGDDLDNSSEKLAAPAFDLLPPKQGLVQVTVRWDEVTDPRVTGYQIFRADGNLQQPALLTTLDKSARTFIDTGVALDVVYGYQVVAVGETIEGTVPALKTVVGLTQVVLTRFEATFGAIDQGASSAEWLHRELSQGVPAAEAFAHTRLTRAIYIHVEEGQLSTVATAVKNAGIEIVEGQTLAPLLAALAPETAKTQLEFLQQLAGISDVVIEPQRAAPTVPTDTGNKQTQCDLLLEKIGAKDYLTDNGEAIKIGFLDKDAQHWTEVKENLTCIATQNGKLTMEIDHKKYFHVGERGAMALIDAMKQGYDIISASVYLQGYVSIEKMENLLQISAGAKNTLLVISAGNEGQRSRRGEIGPNEPFISQTCADREDGCYIVVYLNNYAAKQAGKGVKLLWSYLDPQGNETFNPQISVLHDKSVFAIRLRMDQRLRVELTAESPFQGKIGFYSLGSQTKMTGPYQPGYSIHGWNAFPGFLTVGAAGGLFEGTNAEGYPLGYLGQLASYSSVGPGLLWHLYKPETPEMFTFTQKPDLVVTAFLVGLPATRGGTSSAAPTVAGMAALIMSKKLANGAQRGPDLIKAVIAELRARVKKVDLNCAACQPTTDGPATWSDASVRYADNYGVGLAQLTWERFDWGNWGPISAFKTAEFKDYQTVTPVADKPLFFTREWVLSGSYWCSFRNNRTGECVGTDPPTTISGQACMCSEYNYYPGVYHDFSNEHFEDNASMIEAFCGNVGFDGVPAYKNCEALCQCSENPSDAPMLMRVCNNPAECSCSWAESSWIWLAPGKTACRKVLKYERLYCEDTNGDGQNPDVCVTVDILAGEYWDPLQVKAGEVNSETYTNVRFSSGLPTNQNKPEESEPRIISWVAGENDPAIPVDANSEIVLRVEPSGDVRVKIGLDSNPTRVICLAAVSDFCDKADVSVTPDFSGLVRVRLGTLFGESLKDKIGSVEFQLGNASTLRIHSVDITPAP